MLKYWIFKSSLYLQELNTMYTKLNMILKQVERTGGALESSNENKKVQTKQEAGQNEINAQHKSDIVVYF